MEVDDVLIALFLIGLVATGIEGLFFIAVKAYQFYQLSNYLMLSLVVSPILLAILPLIVLLIKS